MSLEKIFLILAVLGFLAYAFVIATAMVALLPWGIIGLAILAFIGYIAWRMVKEHMDDPEDRYYEDKFDK
ncbi:MAG: hypothetical protein V3V02_00615 [Rhizobiaceae bacterium]